MAFRGRTYQLRGSEVRTLATVGAFRAVPAADLGSERRERDIWNGDLRSLAEQGLVERKTIMVNHEPADLVVLTKRGKALLDAHRDENADGRRQVYHAGLVKPRELAHDAQLYRMYQAEAARIEDAGGQISRVVLDYELKRDYQTFLNRPDHDADGDADREAFAAAHGLPVVDGHLELPDLRIEYETADGRLEYRDLELVTEHYSRSQLAGKAQAGFALYRSAGAGRSQPAGGSSRRGGTPFDPHAMERLLR